MPERLKESSNRSYAEGCASMLPFDVILFDVGGVLLTNSWDVHQREQAAVHFQLDLDELRLRHDEVIELWERGGLAMSTYLDVTVFYEPRSFSRDEFIAYMFDQSKLLPNGALGILKELSDSGKYLIGSLNNESRELNEYRFNAFGLRKYFEVALSSCYVGLRKPDAAIYQRAIDIVGGPPQRILFIDDRPENVAGAAGCGMTATRFTGADALREELGKMGTMEQAAD
jgi:putative hydrolase of the HAD superfamily